MHIIDSLKDTRYNTLKNPLGIETHKAKHRKVLDYSNIVAIEWDDGGTSWTNKKLLKEI